MTHFERNVSSDFVKLSFAVDKREIVETVATKLLFVSVAVVKGGKSLFQVSPLETVILQLDDMISASK